MRHSMRVIAMAGLTGIIMTQVPFAYAAGVPEHVQEAGAANAAPRYWQAMYLLDNSMKADPDLDLSVGDASIGLIDEKKAEALRPFVEKNREAVRLFVEASKIGPCDFVGDSLAKDGPLALLPHLGPMRRGVHLTIASAVIDAKDGKAAQSAESLAAVLRATRHVQSDGVLISSLVSVAFLELNAATINWALDRGHFGDAEKAALAAALKGLSNDDPFAVVGSIKGERDSFLGWMRREYAPGKELSPAAAEFLKSFGSSGRDVKAVRTITDTVERGQSIEPYVLLSERYFNEALAAWNTPDAGAALSKLSKRLDEGAFGPLSSFMAPAFENVRKAEQKGRTALALLQVRVGQ